MGPKSSLKIPSGGSKAGGGGGGIALGQVEQILTQLAPNDASHDFGTNKPDTPQQKEAYKKGLYKGSGNAIDYGTEAESLSMVVSDPPNYIPITSANEKRDYCRTSEHTITVLGDEKKIYTVKYADVKYTNDAKVSYKKMLDAKEEADKAKAKVAFDAIVKGLNDDKNTKMAAAAEPALVATPAESFIGNLKEKITKTLAEITASKSSKSSSKSEPKDEREEIDAPMFYDMMGLDPNQNIALVIDAASIGIIQILSTGTFQGKRPIVYYIYGPEVVHDPATKKHPSSPEFKGPHGVLFIPCVSMNPRDFVYCYDYNPDPTGLYLNKFFTSFEFGLSELQETVNGKTIDYTTDLTIKAFDGPEKTKVKFIDESIDSKSKSDISFLTEMINMLRNAMASGDEKEFQYAIAYLKKMAGDWLQVLLAVAIAMRSRGFTPYRGPAPSAEAAGGGAAGGGGKEIRPNITATIDRVFFLTHDQIALAFALCNGVECIFTHHTVVKGKGNPSLHSAFLYSLMSPEKVKESIINKAKELKPKDYAAEIATLTSNVEEYDEKRNAAIFGPVNALKNDIGDYLEHIIANPFQVDWFDKYVRTLFTASMKIVAIKKILPDPKTIKLDELSEKNTDLKTALERFKSDENVETAKQLLELDAYVDSQIKSCEKTIASAQYFFSQKDEGSPMVINEQVREFTKELIYVAAANWTWDSHEVITRKLTNLTSMNDQRVFNADRNIFINHLNSLDDDIKSQITLIFARCYDFIQKNDDHTQFQNTIKKGKDKTETTAILTPPQFQKFKPMATTFCYEVFLNLGGKYNIPSDTTGKIITKEIIDGYCDTIITVNAVKLLKKDNISESAETTIKPEDLTANHTSETVLVQQMNERDNGGIDSFEKEHVFNPEEITILTSSKETLPPSPPSTSSLPLPPRKPSKNSMRFSSVFSACQLLKERILSQTLGRGERNIGLFGGAKNRAMRMKGGASPMCNFHHQLPLYILLFQLHKTLSNENFEESLDYELTLEYYGFLLKIQEEFAKLQKDKEKAIKIGLGIRDFFFINNVVSDKVKVKELPPMPSKFLSFSGLLTTGFCGALNEKYFTNVGDREASIKDPVFVDFIEGIKIPERFSGQLDLVSDGVVYKDFVKAVSHSANEVAQQIIADRASEREQMISESVSNVTNVVVEEDEGGADIGRNMTGPGLTPKEMQYLNPVPSVFSGLQQQPSYGGRKTRRRKRTRRPKKQNNKKTRKRRR